ncbi:MAG: TRAP transporter small permease [Gammaproteobacteria bacterium]|nr:TRAP transporter small permease [Gammaproteobacteria bacterium]
MSTLLRPLEVTLAALDRAAQWLIVILMTTMVTVVSAQVLLRYGFNSSIGWAEEISRLTFVWSIFLGIPLGIKAGSHIGIELLTARLPATLRNGIASLIAGLGAALMLLVCYEAAVITYTQWDEKLASADFSAALFVLAVAVGSAHSALHLIWLAATGERKADQDVTKVLE